MSTTRMNKKLVTPPTILVDINDIEDPALRQLSKDYKKLLDNKKASVTEILNAAKQSPDMAKLILQSNSLLKILKRNENTFAHHIADIASSHPQSAYFILTTKNYAAILNEHQLTAIALTHAKSGEGFKLAKTILGIQPFVDSKDIQNVSDINKEKIVRAYQYDFETIPSSSWKKAEISNIMHKLKNEEQNPTIKPTNRRV